MYDVLLFLKRRFSFRRPGHTPATLNDVRRAADHAQDQFDDLHRRLVSWLRNLDERIDRIDARADFILGVLDTAAKLNQRDGERFERALRVLAESLKADLADIDTEFHHGRLPRQDERTALERHRKLTAQLGMARDALAQLIDQHKR